MRVIQTEQGLVKMWAQEVEQGAWDQIQNLAALPFIHRHVAIMPDCHQGYGMPIGGVLATHNVVIPNAVGVDIGCGMCAIRTNLTEIDIQVLKRILGRIRTSIPVGFAHHQKAQDESLMPMIEEGDGSNCTTKKLGWTAGPVILKHYDSAPKQLGTLGGGNHFIEIQRGDDGHIWIMIHSGSRNLGKQVADHYNKLAVELNAWWHSSVPAAHQLAFLPASSDEGQHYLREMQYCVNFAFANRQLMMKRCLEAFYEELKGTNDTGACSITNDWKRDLINIAHNYAAVENHFGQNVYVHRKGATRARVGEIGIIPGSQGTKSYIVEGLGNPESFQSCSHGAGRRLGRKQASRELSLEMETAAMNAKGILHSIRNQNDLDEAPGAYKSIEEVMANQQDLVKVLVELTPLAVVKG